MGLRRGHGYHYSCRCREGGLLCHVEHYNGGDDWLLYEYCAGAHNANGPTVRGEIPTSMESAWMNTSEELCWEDVSPALRRRCVGSAVIAEPSSTFCGYTSPSCNSGLEIDKT